ncbi:MAG: trigger factor [Candidatus Omnitrophota bacterium]
MKIEVKKIDKTKREISIEVGQDTVKNKFSDVFKKISQEAKVPGFRVGHVPQEILEKHYSTFAHEQVLKELVPDVYRQAIEKEGLDAVELPRIFDVRLDRQGLSFKAAFEVVPQIDLKNYKGLAVHYKSVRVEPDEVKRSIDSLKEMRKAQSLDDNFAKGLGYPSLAELQNALEKQIFLQKENIQRQNVENEVIESLLKDADVKAPDSLVKRQLEDLVRQAKVDLALKGLPREKIDEQENTLRQEFKAQAEKQVKVYLALSEIARKENIAIDDNMPRAVMEFLLKEADWQIQS